VVSIMQTVRTAPSRMRSNATRSALVAALAATAVAVGLLLFTPGAAQAIDPGTTRFDQTDEHIDYVGTWDTFEKSAAYKTAYSRANTKGTAAIIYFDGTRLDWIAMKGSSTGKADVYLDGVFQKTVDLAAASASYQVNVWTTGVIAPGHHSVRIARSLSTPAGTFITLDAVDVTGTLIYGPPAITGLGPVSGGTGGGASVAISGSDLLETSAVTFGGVNATSFTVESSTLVTAAAPAHAAGTVNVQVTTASGASTDTVADDFLYAPLSVPTITGLGPASGAPGTEVVITGTGFIGLSGPDAVTFGSTQAANYVVDSPTQVTAVAPAHDSAKLQVKVKAAGGTTADTPADDFTFFTRYEQTDVRVSYAGNWETYSTASALSGSYARSSTSGATVTLTFTGTRLTWIAMKGTTTGLADVYLDGTFKTTIDLAAATPTYQQEVWTTGDVSNAVHTVKIVRNATSAAGKYLTIDAVDVVGTLLGSGTVEQTDTRLAFAGTWSSVTATGASGGSYKRATGSGAAVYVDFTGIDLAWVTTVGPTMGKAWVSVDGGAAQSVDLYAATTAYKQKVWDSGPLTLGDHEVKIWWDTVNLSTRYVTADAFTVLGTLRQAYLWHRYEQTDVRLIATDSWSTVSAAGASGASYKRTSSTSAFFDFMFNGRQASWLATTGPSMGKAKVSIDGGAAVVVDLYSVATLDKQTVWSSAILPDGTHRVQIWVSDTSTPGAYIDVDAIDVHGSLPSVTTLTGAKNLWAETRLKELSYLPGTVDGTVDTKTTGAVIAFQKWEGLTRDGVIGATVWARLHTASRPVPTRIGTTNPWIEVDLSKQVLMFCKNGAVLYTIHVSTGSASVGMLTPKGTFTIISKTPPREHLYYPMAITTGIAIHGYPTVPTTPASHGCVRTQNWDQDVLYALTPMGARVYIYD
jgi:hypothetical protein